LLHRQIYELETKAYAEKFPVAARHCAVLFVLRQGAAMTPAAGSLDGEKKMRIDRITGYPLFTNFCISP